MLFMIKAKCCMLTSVDNAPTASGNAPAVSYRGGLHAGARAGATTYASWLTCVCGVGGGGCVCQIHST